MVAQFVEHWLLTPETRGSNPNFGKILANYELHIKIEKMKIKKKEARNGPSLKTHTLRIKVSWFTASPTRFGILITIFHVAQSLADGYRQLLGVEP